jgi:hypothetical protein
MSFRAERGICFSRVIGIMPNVGLLTYNDRVMKFEDYKIILYRQENGSWVAEIPALPACYALMKTLGKPSRSWLTSLA